MIVVAYIVGYIVGALLTMVVSARLRINWDGTDLPPLCVAALAWPFALTWLIIKGGYTLGEKWADSADAKRQAADIAKRAAVEVADIAASRAGKRGAYR